MSDNSNVVRVKVDCDQLREIFAGVPDSEAVIRALDCYMQAEQLSALGDCELRVRKIIPEQVEVSRLAAYQDFVHAWSQIRVTLTRDQMAALGY